MVRSKHGRILSKRKPHGDVEALVFILLGRQAVIMLRLQTQTRGLVAWLRRW